MNKIKNNLCLHKTKEAFSEGTFKGIIIKEGNKINLALEKSNGNYIEKGTYISDVIYTNPFHYLIFSWNAHTPKGTSVKIEAQVLVNKDSDQIWSSWLSYGNWCSEAERHSESSVYSPEELAYLDTDTLKVKCPNGEFANAVKYRLTLTTSDSKATPTVNLIALSIRSMKSEEDIKNIYANENLHDLLNLNKELTVPRFSQMLRDRNIANIICSPTSITMILNYYRLNLLPEETAAGVYDSKYQGYGNWPFNTAFAGSMGFEAYVTYCSSIYDLKKEIYNGYPAAVSVKYKNSHQVPAMLPVIHGAPITKTNGHLIVVCGFVIEDNKEFVIVNDPAAESDETVRLKYDLQEFEDAWTTSGRVAYIIHP